MKGMKIVAKNIDRKAVFNFIERNVPYTSYYKTRGVRAGSFTKHYCFLGIEVAAVTYNFDTGRSNFYLAK